MLIVIMNLQLLEQVTERSAMTTQQLKKQYNTQFEGMLIYFKNLTIDTKPFGEGKHIDFVYVYTQLCDNRSLITQEHLVLCIMPFLQQMVLSCRKLL